VFKWILLIAVVVIAVMIVRGIAERRRIESSRQRELEGQLASVRNTTEEDITVFGEELQELDSQVLGAPLDSATRQDYQRALDAYENAKTSIAAVTRPDDIRHVTEILEDGRYAVACVQARLAGQPLPARRPPCFFNPRHGPSTTTVSWAPPGGSPRDVPACAADAERVEAGAEPDTRQVMVGAQRVPYWQGGPAYQPMMAGYFGGYAGTGLLPGFLAGMLTANLMSAAWGDPFGTGSFGGGDGGGYDGGGSDGGDGSGGDGGDGSGGDGGDGGGYDNGGGGDNGFDGGGYSGGGGDSFFGGGGDGGGGFDGGGFDFGG